MAASSAVSTQYTNVTHTHADYLNESVQLDRWRHSR